MADAPSFPAPSNQPVRGLRLLSFDGGGIRGLSSLLILKEIMSRIQREEGLDELPLPWKYFDLMAGTSTGGLIAIMLGRLRMSIEEAINCYGDLAERIFSEKKHTWQDGRFKATRLEEVIKEIVHDHTQPKDKDTRMLDIRSDCCKVFVCAMSAENMAASIPTQFRTYRAFQNEAPNCKIWEACRATSAAPTFFKRITIEDMNLQLSYIDGGFGCNNPTARVLAEAKHMFPGAYVSCILSIGTGQAKTIAIPKPGLMQSMIPLDVVNAMKKIATDCERIAQDMAARFENFPGVYFRFNVDQGLQNVGLGAWEKLSEVGAHTHAYMRLHENNQRANNAASALMARKLMVPTATVAQ